MSMAQNIELTHEDIEFIIDEIFKNNTELADWSQQDGRIKEELIGIFYADTNEKEEMNYHNYENEYYGTGKKASLYFRDSRKHICAKSIVLDFIKIIFAPSTWKCVMGSYCMITGKADYKLDTGDVVVLINKIKNMIIENVVNLEKESFCFYLQMITHFKERRSVTLAEMLEWLPEAGLECSYSAVEIDCQFRENGLCVLKGKANYNEIVGRELITMSEHKILLKSLNEEDKYRINY